MFWKQDDEEGEEGEEAERILKNDPMTETCGLLQQSLTTKGSVGDSKGAVVKDDCNDRPSVLAFERIVNRVRLSLSQINVRRRPVL